MRRRTIMYISLHGTGCGLSTDSEKEIFRREGTSNVREVRPATQKDVDWVKAMGGYVPDGIIRRDQK